MTAARTGATKTDYLRAFHRYNLVVGRNWHAGDARENWQQLWPHLEENFDRVVLLGNAVRQTGGVPLEQFAMSPGLVCIPHPSGLNRWYNDQRNRELVELAMEELYWEATHDQP